MIGNYDFDYRAYYDISRDQTVPIRSPVGQARFFLSAARDRIRAPNEWLLLCRYANTIDISCGGHELRQLKRLAQHLERCDFEKRCGHVDPVVARMVEREIVLRQEEGFAAGYDLSPAMELLEEYEQKAPVFSQPERNLILRDAFFFRDQIRTAKIADAFCEKQLSPYGIERLCRELEEAERERAGVETMEGLQYLQAEAPGVRGMNLKDCEDPQAHYPPFTYYPPCDQPADSIVLSNGVILLPDQKDWFCSALQKVDQTFTALHFYKSEKHCVFEIADQEHEDQFQYQDPEPTEECEFIGRVTFANGDLWNFTDAQKYLQVIHDELPHHLRTGFQYETLTNDPVIRKAIDDMHDEIYEESPHTQTDCYGIGMTMGGMC